MFKRLDDFLLHKAERFAHWFQRMTGRTNFWLAKLCFVAYCLGGGVSMLLVPVPRAIAGPNADAMNWFGPVMMGTVLLVGTWRLFPYIARVEEHYLSGNHTAHAFTLLMSQLWPLRLLTMVMRLPATFTLAYSLLDPSHAVALGGGAGLVLFSWTGVCCYYFASVVPLPPGKSKVREFLESLLPAPQTAQAESSAL